MNRRNWEEKTEFAELGWLSGGHGNGVWRSHGPVATASLMTVVQILVLDIRGRLIFVPEDERVRQALSQAQP
jgi:hypothetical protein